jgi:hypothetical protein
LVVVRMVFPSSEMVWAVGAIATGVTPNANAPTQPRVNPTLLSRPAMAPSSHRTPEISQVQLSYRLIFVRGMKMPTNLRTFLIGMLMPVEGFSRVSRPIRTWLNGSEELLGSNLIRESDLTSGQ